MEHYLKRILTIPPFSHSLTSSAICVFDSPLLWNETAAVGVRRTALSSLCPVFWGQRPGIHPSLPFPAPPSYITNMFSGSIPRGACPEGAVRSNERLFRTQNAFSDRLYAACCRIASSSIECTGPYLGKVRRAPRSRSSSQLAATTPASSSAARAMGVRSTMKAEPSSSTRDTLSKECPGVCTISPGISMCLSAERLPEQEIVI